MTRPDPGATAQDALVLHMRDNVATALRDLDAGHGVQTPAIGAATLVLLREPIAMCHKFALRAIAPGAVVIKYGEAIGRASVAIAAGEHVHTHNLRSARAQVSEDT